MTKALTIGEKLVKLPPLLDDARFTKKKLLNFLAKTKAKKTKHGKFNVYEMPRNYRIFIVLSNNELIWIRKFYISGNTIHALFPKKVLLININAIIKVDQQKSTMSGMPLKEKKR